MGGVVFDEVQSDLEAASYEVTPFLLPAAGINAPHRRDRIFFIAYSASFRCQRELYKGERISGRGAFRETGAGNHETVTDTNCQLFRHGYNGAREIIQDQIKGDERGRVAIPNFNHWPSKPGVHRGNDGISNQVDRIKGLGNAVVPQVVLQIFKAIEAYEKSLQ